VRAWRRLLIAFYAGLIAFRDNQSD